MNIFAELKVLTLCLVVHVYSVVLFARGIWSVSLRNEQRIVTLADI